MNLMHRLRSRLFVAIALGSLPMSPAAVAQEFAAVVSPPRFEMAAKPGERIRQVVEITNAGSQAATYHLRTADWSLGADGGVAFSEELTPGSCRPWVAIERHEIEVPAGGRYRYRMEVQPPADAPAGECRFALMIEGDAQHVQTAGGMTVPVSGRIGVIVYVSVGTAAPELRFASTSVVEPDRGPTPALTVHNAGNAHGRLDGFLTGTDAEGRRLEFTPSSLPILPGETRTIPLTATDGPTVVASVAYPIRLQGVIEWGGRRTELDEQFAQ